MGPVPFVLDISSDEEDAVFDGSGKGSLDCKSSLEWLSEMLELEDEPWASKDVVDVDELNCTAAIQKLSPVRSFMAKLDSDDDCKVLDGDPDKPVDVTQKEGNGSDELLIVGEKGQVACRDFPHSRHLCATFPFGTTSHEKFCKLCHCYVCDVPAPCIYWGTGSSDVDHCHSSDKEGKWRLQRKALRHANSTAVNTESAVATPSIRPPGMRSPGMRVPGTMIFRNYLPQTMSSTSMLMGRRSVPHTSIPMRGSAPAQTSVPLQNSDSRLHTLRPCSTTSFGTPNIISQRRNQNSGISHSIHRFTQQFDRARKFPETDGIRKECSGLSPQVLSAHARGRMAGADFINATTKRPRTPSNAKPNQVYSRKLQRSSCLPASSVDERFRQWQDVLLGRDSYPETNLWQCGVYPQPEVDSQTCIRTGPDIGMDLRNSPTPATSNLNGGWLSAASANTTSHVSLANSPLPYIHHMDLYAVPENNPVPGAAPLGELIGSPGQTQGEPFQEVAGEQGLKELNPCTYDEQEMSNSLLHV